MEILTKESLAAAVKKCQENERYQVLIVTEYAEDVDSFLDYLPQIDGAAVTRCRGNSWATFDNGSFMRMISMNSNSTRGRKVDLVLCAEKFFDDDVVRRILQSFERYNTSFKLEKNEV